ncbi:MAG: BREX system Lon protease-like protein BrxL [Candidatus Helarchaeota archaeon]
MNNLKQKFQEIFGDKIVNKRLAQLQEFSKLPRYVTEYLLMRYSDGDTITPENLMKINNFVRKHFPELREKQKILNDIMETGEYKLLDFFSLETDIINETHYVIIPSLDIRKECRILPDIIDRYENLLRGGMWGIGTISYDRRSEIDSRPLLLTEFIPFQVSNFDFDEYIENRSKFSLDEWIILLINSIGLNPAKYNRRQKLILLSRLIPLVEPNVNIIELGPKGTGKTFSFRHISHYVHIVSGGTVSPAQLFFNLNTKSLGLLGLKECVVFDEVSKISFIHTDEIMGKLKDYMESGNFDRGGKSLKSDASIVLLGNLPVKEISGIFQPMTHHLFDVLPKFLKDTAFLDRLNGFIPGWELSRISHSTLHLSKDYGLISDYFCEVLHEARKLDFRSIIKKIVSFGDEVDIRDEKSIEKIASGLLKILLPNAHIELDYNILELVMNIAIEYRQRIIDQLHVMDPEYKTKKLTYELIK